MSFVAELLPVIGGAASLVSLPGSCELLLLTAASLLPSRTTPPVAEQNALPFRLAVIIPAHNEEQTLPACLQSLRAAVRETMRPDMVLVADNCSDRTAEIARANGARVLVRADAQNRGKGYALQFAFDTLLPEGYDAFLVVDADTTVASNFLDECLPVLARGTPAVQCRYLAANHVPVLRFRLLRIALAAFNVVRPTGRERLGLSCGMYGNGFGLRRETLLDVPYVSCSLVEDLEYHLRLIRSGLSVRFVETTTVYGEMPVRGKGVGSQRQRWEGGRLRMLLEQSPQLIFNIVRGKVRAVEPLLDLLLLPLGFHLCLLLIALFAPFPMKAIAVTGLIVLSLHVARAVAVLDDATWSDVGALGALPFYLVWKLAMLPGILWSARPGASWIRTERATDQDHQ